MKKLLLYSIPLAAVLIGGTQVSAGNSGDTSFDFNFQASNWLGNGGVQYQNTENRAKKDATSSYMYLSSITSGYWYTAWVEVGTEDMSGGNYYAFNANGQSKKLSNYVYEQKGAGTFTHIKANLGLKAEVKATGVWSPDSI